MSAIILNYEFGLSTMKRDFTNLVMGFFDETDECDEQQKHILSVILLQPEALLSVMTGLVNYLTKIILTFVNKGFNYFISFTSDLFVNNSNTNVYKSNNHNNFVVTNVNSDSIIDNSFVCTFVKSNVISKHYINNALFFIIRKIKANFSVFLFNFEKNLIRQWG